jgi:hypothetical protein
MRERAGPAEPGGGDGRLTGVRLRSATTLALIAAIAVAVQAAPATATTIAKETPGPGKVECRPFDGERTSATCGARILDDGRAVPPPGAPPQVRAVIEAANRIEQTPYVWGGGHQRWEDRGYDCSGAVGYALHGAGLLDQTMVSGTMATYLGEPGTGRWISVYANARHVYMVVAGLRFDTRDGLTPRTGPRWHADMPRNPGRHFTARHPAGL